MEDNVKHLREIADRILFNDPYHEKEIINQINQRVRISPIKSKRKWPQVIQYLVNGSILAIFVLAFSIIIINKLDIFGDEQSSLKKNTASVDDATIHYDPATFKGKIYTGLSSDYGKERARKDGITQDFQKTVTSNNVQFKIEDVYYDGPSFSIAYRVINQGSEKLKEHSFDLQEFNRNKFSITLNHTERNLGYGMSGQEKKISPEEYQGVLHISLEHPDKKFTINLSVTSLMGIKGEWNLDIPVSNDKVKNSIAMFYPNYKTTWQDGEITVNKVMFTPSAIVIELNKMVKGKIEDVMGANSIQYSLLTPTPEADGGFSSQAVPLNDGKVLLEDIVHFSPKGTIPKELTLRAYNSKDGSEVHRFTIPLQDTKRIDNELAVEVDGKTEMIPAKTLNNVGIVKEIKIPVDGTVRNIDENGTIHKTASGMKNLEAQPFIFETGSSKMSIKERQMVGTIPHYLDDFKPSEQNNAVPVDKVELEKYPQLKGYDGMVQVEGKYLTEYYIIKSFEKDGHKKIREIKIQSPTSSGEIFLLKMIGSLSTAKFN